MQGAGRRRTACALAALPVVAALLANGLWLDALARRPLVFWLVDVAQWIVLPLACLVALWRWGGVTPAAYGLRGPRDGRGGASLARDAGLVTLVLAAVYFASSHLAALIFPGDAPQFSYEAQAGGGPWKPLAVLYLAATAGVVEEICFRGLPWAALGPTAGGGRRPAVVYVVVSSLLFALIHWENGAAEMLAALVYGIAAASLYLKIGNLWPLVGAHAAIDVVEFW